MNQLRMGFKYKMLQLDVTIYMHTVVEFPGECDEEKTQGIT